MGYFQFHNRASGAGVPTARKILVNDSQTLVVGDLLIVSSGKASKAAEAVSDDTILGIATSNITTTTATTSDFIEYIPIFPDMLFRVTYTGSSKTSLAATDLQATAFDITTAHKLDLDDTTGGIMYVEDYNNNDKMAVVRFVPAKLYLV